MKKTTPFYTRLAHVLISIICLFYLAIIGETLLAPLIFAFLFSLLLLPFANFLERKFPIIQHHLGFTTGLGFNFTQYAFNNNYIINTSGSTISAAVDPIYTYSKNKLNATYLTLPLMLEFCSNKYEDEGFYFAAGLVGGVKIYSRIHREGSFDGKTFDESAKGDYAINPFILNSVVRIGYQSIGLFVDYSLLSYFKPNKTDNVHPLAFGVTLNF